VAGNIGFIFFSMLEGLGLYAMMLAVFRFNPWKHVKLFSLILSVMVLQSLFLRETQNVEFLVPVINILLFTFFIRSVMKEPVIWSLIMTIGGYVGYGLIQWGVIEVAFGSVQVAQSTHLNGYIVQSATAVIQIVITLVLLKYRIGFTFDMEELRIRHERVIVMALIILSIVGLATVAVTVKAIPIVIISFIIFLYFMVKKEKAEND